MQTLVHRSNIYYSKVYQKENWKENMQFPPEQLKKIRLPRHLDTPWTFRHRHSIKFSKNKIDSKIIISHQCFQERSHAVLSKCWLIMNSNQGLALFRIKQILRYNWHKNLQKQNNDDFFIHLLNVWLHFTNNKSPAPMSIEQILHQPIHLNPYTKLDFSSNKPCFYSILSKNISDNYN